MTIQQLLSRSGLLLSPDGDGSATPPPPPSGAAEGAVDTVPLPRKEYEAFVASRTRAEQLEAQNKSLTENWEAAQRLIKGDGDPAVLESSTRHVLKAAGWSDAQINSHLEELRGGEETPTQKTPRSDGRGSKKGGGLSTPPDEPSELEQMQQELVKTQQQVAQQEVHRLGGIFKGAVSNVLDTTPELVTVMADLVKASAPSDEGKAKVYKDNLREMVTSEVDREFKSLLNMRRSQSGNRWDESWVPDAAAKAAKAVAAKYRTFVPDPSRLGRVGETGVGDDYITNTTPVSKPSYKKGDSVSDVEAKARAWSADFLLRGGETMKV